MSMPITGTHFVRVLRSGLQKARHLWPKIGDRMEVRRQALKLRFWGDRHDEEEEFCLIDMSYEKVKGVRGDKNIYELRLQDKIGGVENIRIIFFVPPDDWVPQDEMPLPVIWLLEPVAKKREGWTANDLSRFAACRAIIKERFY
jgi:hypothetical protein